MDEQNIASKPVAVVCMPDIPSVRENEIEMAEKQESELKNTDEIIKTVSAGSVAKCEKDNEEENIMLKKPNTTGRSPPKIVKKKPKQIRDLEKTLNCLLSDNEQIKDEKAFAFAQSYFLKVTETLHGKDDTTYSDFMKTMNDFGVTIFDATELYKKVTKVFEKYPSLSEEFLAFLLPEQAMQCGKFMEYIILTKMRSFCRKLELYYSKQPSQLRKIYSSLSTLAANNKATLDDLKNTILPLLRNNSLLVNMFLELMPTEAPHASSLTDYESMDFCSVDIHNQKPEDWFETVEVPPPVEDNIYGGEDCICPCHIPLEGKTRRCSAHCMSCGTKFIQGRVYIHSGSMLRPARVSFKEMKTKAIERLSVKNLKTRRKIDKNQAPSSSSKKNNSSKGETASTNAAGVCNKLSSPKTTKKAPKGKSMNENQKKSNKTLSAPKTSHNKQLSNDKKISKPPRKRIKLIKNSENSSTTASVKSPLVSSRKGTPQTSKVVGKVNVKASKGQPQFPVQQTEPTRRTARSAARNVTLTNESNQKSNRRNVGNILKEETVPALATVILNKKDKEEGPLKNKSLLSAPLTVVQDKQRTLSKLLHGSSDMAIEPMLESSSEENVDNNNLKWKDIEMKNDMKSQSSDNETTKLLVSSVIPNEGKREVLLQRVVEPDVEEEKCKEKMELDYCDEKISLEDNSKKSNSVTQNEYSVLCPYTSSDDSSSDHVMDIPTQESKMGVSSHSEVDDVKSETIELDNSIENVSSEDDKNVLDSDFPINSSDSEIEDSYPVDSEDAEEVEDCSRSSQSDINIDSLNDGNCFSDITNKSVTDQPDSIPWTRDEDKIILRAFQSVNNSDHVFQKICHELPSRTAEEIQSRFQTLMSFLQKMAID